MLAAVKYEIRDATEEDAVYLSTRLRAIDVREIGAVSGRSPKAALISGVRGSEYCKAGVADGEVVCIYGVRRVSALDDECVIWMLGTDELPKHAVRFIRGCSAEVVSMVQQFKLVENWCHAENKTTIRWLKWLGFKIEEAAPYGRKNEPFHHFYARAA
jgi:hypothetical protein